MSKQVRKWMAQEITKDFSNVDSFVVFEYGPINAEQNRALRTQLMQQSIKVKFLKNTIASIAFSEAFHKNFENILSGPVAIVYGGESPVAMIKTLIDWNKKRKLITIKGGYLSGQVLNSKEVDELSKTPDKKTLLSMVAGVLQSPAQQIATILNASMQDFTYALNDLAEKKS